MSFYFNREVEVEVAIDIEPEDLGLCDPSDWLEAADLDVQDIVDYYDAADFIDAAAEKLGIVSALRRLDPTDDQVLEAFGESLMGQLTYDAVRDWIKALDNVVTLDFVATVARARENEVRRDAVAKVEAQNLALRKEINSLKEKLAMLPAIE